MPIMINNLISWDLLTDSNSIRAQKIKAIWQREIEDRVIKKHLILKSNF
jgi:hypothetical protein